MSANLDELVPPDWLTLDFVQVALRKYKNDENLTVLDIVVKPGSSKGDHFASIMFRIEATITESGIEDQHQIRLILKTMPFEAGIKMDFLKDSPLFDVEIKMYDKILPAMEPLLEKCGIPSFWPTLVYQTYTPRPVLIFEDLSPDGFIVPKDPFDLEFGKILYSRLAAIHATSFYLHHVTGYDFGKDFNKGIFDLPVEATENFFGKHLDFFIDEIATWPGYEVHHEKLKVFRTKFIKIGQKTSTCIPGAFNVLNHGDFHQKNILFKLATTSNAATTFGSTPDGLIVDYKILDYQICFWTSPGLDLMYSMHMMMKQEIRRQYRDELIKHYHDEFCKILKQLDFEQPIPTLEDLYAEIERFGFLEVILCLCFLPFIYLDFSKLDEDFTEFFGEDEKMMAFKRSLFKNEEYQKVVKAEMPRFLKMGFMDV